MKGSEKGLSPSKSNANRKLSPSGSVENNENDSSLGKLISQFENHKIKHSISGAPRKKILAEISDVPCSSDAQNHENPNLGLGNSSPEKGVSDGVLSCYGHASEPKDDSSVKVYDPLTNYLSPRPKYLRFNPNRRVEILKRLENEGREELNNSPDSEVNDNEETSANEVEDSYLSPPKACVGNDRNGGESEEDNHNVIDGYEAEEEEEIEERGWCLRGALKLFLTLIACVLSISCICSMNPPTDSPIQQAVWNLIDSAVMIKNGSLEFDSTKRHHDGFFKVDVGGNHRLIEDIELDGSYGVIDETFEAKIVENLERFENFEIDESSKSEEEEVDEERYGEIDESFEAEIVENLERFEMEMIRNENGDSKEMVDEAAVLEGVRAAQFEFRADGYEQLIDAKTDEVRDDGVIQLDEEVDSSYTGLDENEASETEIIGGGEVDSDPHSSEQLIGAKTNESEDASGNVMEMDIIDTSNWLQAPELSLESISEEIPKELECKGADESRSLELVRSHGELSDSMDEDDEMGDDAEVGNEKLEWNATTVAEVSAVLIVLTTLAIIYHSKKPRGSTSSEEVEQILKQNLAVEENVSPVLPSIERKVEFLPRASLSSDSMREAKKELAHHINAPTVELISEIVVGHTSNRRGYMMTISEDECNATFYQRQGSLPKLVSAPSQPSAIELHSTTSDTSYGSFTTERRISNKEGGQSREAILETTPIRRSNRLLNRSTVKSR